MGITEPGNTRLPSGQYLIWAVQSPADAHGPRIRLSRVVFEPRLVRTCRDRLGIDESRARLLLEAHELLLKAAVRRAAFGRNAGFK